MHKCTKLQPLLNPMIKRLMTFLMRKGFLIDEERATYLTDTDPDSRVPPPACKPFLHEKRSLPRGAVSRALASMPSPRRAEAPQGCSAE